MNLTGWRHEVVEVARRWTELATEVDTQIADHVLATDPGGSEKERAPARADWFGL